MPSSGRHILDFSKKGPSRGKARGQMMPLFDGPPKKEAPKSRPERLRVKRRRQRIFIGSLIALAILGSIGGIGALSHLEQLTINSIEVRGVAALQPETLVASVRAGLASEGFRLFAKDNMFLYPKRVIEATLARDFPRIKHVELSRNALLAQAVIVDVKEREAYAKWCTGAITEARRSSDRCYLIDSAGFVFAEAARDATAVPYEFRGGLANDHSPIGQWFLRGKLAEAVALMGRLAAAGHAPNGFGVESDRSLAVDLGTGPILYAPFGEDPDALVRTLETALKAESLEGRIGTLQYIDLRFGNRVYYK